MDCQKISYLNQPLSWMMSSHQANLASMPDHDHGKLIRENDQTLVRGPSNATHRSPSCIKNPSHCSKPQAKNGGDTNTAKRARFQAVDSVLGDKHHNNMNYSLNDSRKDYHHPESFPDFDMYLEHHNSYKKHLTDSQIVPELEYKNLKPGHASGNRQPQQSSLQPCQASARSRGNLSNSLVSADEFPNSKFRKQDSGPDKKLGTLNFSHFIRPAALLQANKRPVTELPILPAGCPNIFNQPDSVATTVKLIKPIAKRPRLAVPDEHSEAVGQKHAFFKYNRSPGQVHNQTLGFEAKADKGKPYIWPPVASSSVSSWGDSNNSTYTLKRRRCYDTEESAYPSENVEEEEPKTVTNAVPVRVSTRAKRSRTAEVHNLSEKRRREKINKKMRALREIIPNCNKVNNVSMLDEAIEYLKTLQLQVQMMSMRTSLCMPPMILPCGMHQINAPHFAHFSPMGVGCNPAQFLASPISVATALPGITGTRFQMPGIPGQGLTMLWSHAPFIPMQGGPSTQSILTHSLSSATTSVEHLSSTPLSIEFKRFNTEHQLRS